MNQIRQILEMLTAAGKEGMTSLQIRSMLTKNVDITSVRSQLSQMVKDRRLRSLDKAECDCCKVSATRYAIAPLGKQYLLEGKEHEYLNQQH